MCLQVSELDSDHLVVLARKERFSGTTPTLNHTIMEADVDYTPQLKKASLIEQIIRWASLALLQST